MQQEGLQALIYCRKGGHHSRRSQRSQRSYEESTAHKPSDALDGAQPPRGVDFETRRQFYAAELEKTLDGVSAEEEKDRGNDSAVPSENHSASEGASPSSRASAREEQQEGPVRLGAGASPDAFPAQNKVHSRSLKSFRLAASIPVMTSLQKPDY